MSDPLPEYPAIEKAMKLLRSRLMVDDTHIIQSVPSIPHDHHAESEGRTTLNDYDGDPRRDTDDERTFHLSVQRLLVEQYMQKSDSKQRRVLRMIDKIDSLDFQSNQERRMCSLRHLIVIVEDILSCHHSTLRMYLWKWQRRIKYLKALRLRVTNSVQRLKNYTMNEYMIEADGDADDFSALPNSEKRLQGRGKFRCV